MQTDPEKELEEQIHQELRDLPPVSAPVDLIARVQSTIYARENRPWWQQPWMAWPMAARVVSALVVCVGVGYGGWLISQPGNLSLDGVGKSLSAWAWVWELALTLIDALVAVLQLVEMKYWLIGGLALLLSYLSCVGLGTLCFRMVYSKR
jgi:hypothetical protein